MHRAIVLVQRISCAEKSVISCSIWNSKCFSLHPVRGNFNILFLFQQAEKL